MYNTDSENIFENVHLIGITEGLGVALGLFYIGIPLITIMGSKIIGKNKKSNIKSILKNAAYSNKELSNFDDKIKYVKIVSNKKLLDMIGKDDSKLNDLKYHVTVCAVIAGANDNIIAYAINDETKNEYAYCICDNNIKSSKIIENYIKALFEVEFGILGSGIKSFTNMKDIDKLHMSASKDYYSNRSDSMEMTKSEYKDAENNIDKITNAILSNFNNSKYSSTISDNSYNGYGHIIHILYSDYPKESDYPKYSDEYEKALQQYYKNHNYKNNDIINDVYVFIKRFGFKKTKTGYTYINNDKYKYIEISIESNDDYDFISVSIYFTKNIKVV